MSFLRRRAWDRAIASQDSSARRITHVIAKISSISSRALSMRSAVKDKEKFNGRRAKREEKHKEQEAGRPTMNRLTTRVSSLCRRRSRRSQRLVTKTPRA